MGQRIFISQAVKDKALVDKIVDLIITGVGGVNANDLFCSSLEGLGVPPGENFIEFIRNKLIGTEVAISVLTPAYFESIFCVAELGAVWANQQSHLAILVPPLDYKDVTAVLTGLQVIKITDEAALSEFRDQLIKILNLAPNRTARWDTKKKEFLKALPKELKKLSPPTKVDYAKYLEIQNKYDESLKEIEDIEEEGKKKNQLIQELKDLKDAEQVNKVVRKHSDKWKTYELILRDVKERLRRLDDCVVQAMYYDLAGKTFMPDASERELWRDLQAAEERNFVSIDTDDGTVSINYDDRMISDTRKSLSELSTFLKKDAGENFRSEFEDEHGYEPNLSNRRLWEDSLGL